MHLVWSSLKQLTKGVDYMVICPSKCPSKAMNSEMANKYIILAMNNWYCRIQHFKKVKFIKHSVHMCLWNLSALSDLITVRSEMSNKIDYKMAAWSVKRRSVAAGTDLLQARLQYGFIKIFAIYAWTLPSMQCWCKGEGKPMQRRVHFWSLHWCVITAF